MRRIEILLLLPLLVAACGPPPPPVPPLDSLYRALGEDREAFDLSRLAGRRILIDPGHGGTFEGTVGRDSLAEKDVNLGVALYLWGLLRDAGADVHLTRASDKDLLPHEGEGGLERDLAARVAIADSLKPELFLSIHHNAAADTNRARNRIETYYRPGDAGPSLDAARSIHAHLLRNLGIPEGAILPGNFHVLRESSCPAVLGEPSYLSHPPVEEKLVLAEKRRLEAEAYFLGIADYFARGVPEARIDEPAERVRDLAGLRFSGVVRDEEGGEGIDPTTATAMLDGRSLPAAYDPVTGRLSALLPADLPAGEHRASLGARNLGGNASRAAEKRFIVELPPASLRAEGVRIPGGEDVHLRLVIEDERGLPVADGTRLELELGEPAGGNFVCETIGGRALVSARGFSSIERIRARAPGVSLETPPGGITWRRPRAILFVLDEEGRPIEGAALRRGAEWIGEALPGGWIALEEVPEPDELLFVETPGAPPLLLDPAGLADGIDTVLAPGPDRAPLGGRRIVVDPEGDGPGAPAGRAAYAASLYLAEMLRFAGAEVELSRPEDRTVDLARKIAASSEPRPDYWIAISIGESLAVRHFPGSGEGTPAAEAIGSAIRDLFGGTAPVEAARDRVLRETPCAAVRVLFPGGEAPPREEGSRLRGLAQAIAGALASTLDRTPAERGALVIRGLAAGALLRVDDACTFQALGADSIVIRSLRAGDHALRYEGALGWEERTIRLEEGGRARLP